MSCSYGFWLVKYFFIVEIPWFTREGELTRIVPLQLLLRTSLPVRFEQIAVGEVLES